MIRRRKPPSQSWRTFLSNHANDLVSVDFFTVPTVTFRVLFVFVILAHDRRQVVHFNVTEHPTAKWTAQQIVEAFPWDTAPRYLLRDRDGVYGNEFTNRIGNMDIEEVKTAPRSPWQSPYVERLIGTMRRDCVDHIVVLHAKHLKRVLRDDLSYYHGFRTHLSLEKDCPAPRAVELPCLGEVSEFPMVGGLHHRYSRLAAQALPRSRFITRDWREVLPRFGHPRLLISAQESTSLLVQMATTRNDPLPDSRRDGVLAGTARKDASK